MNRHRYLSADEVEKRGEGYVVRRGDNSGHTSEDQETVEVFFEKMSKSKKNGVDPMRMLDEYGIDFTRLYITNFVHPRSDRNFMSKLSM